MLGINKYIISPILSGLKAFNQKLCNAAGISESANKGYTHLTKLVGASTGSAGLAKGAVDLAEAIVCRDGLCAVVSTIGCAADAISIATNFVPGANISTIVTVPVSVGCKTFVWCCKRSKLPWGCKN